MERDVLEHRGEGFSQHAKLSHNCWQYLFFKIALSEKDVMEFTGPESYVSRHLLNNDVKFFPIGRAACLEGAHAPPSVSDVFDRVNAVDERAASVGRRLDTLITRLTSMDTSSSGFGLRNRGNSH